MGIADAMKNIEQAKAGDSSKRLKMRQYIAQRGDSFWKKQLRVLEEYHEKYKNTGEYGWIMKREQMKYEREEAIFNWYRKILDAPPEQEKELLAEMVSEIEGIDRQIKEWQEMQVRLDV